MYDGDDYSLEGDMSVPSSRKSNAQLGQPDFNTLDEPIKETIVSLVYIHIGHDTSHLLNSIFIYS